MACADIDSPGEMFDCLEWSSQQTSVWEACFSPSAWVSVTVSVSLLCLFTAEFASTLVRACLLFPAMLFSPRLQGQSPIIRSECWTRQPVGSESSTAAWSSCDTLTLDVSDRETYNLTVWWYDTVLPLMSHCQTSLYVYIKTASLFNWQYHHTSSAATVVKPCLSPAQWRGSYWRDV